MIASDMLNKVIHRKVNTPTDKIAGAVFAVLLLLNVCYVVAGSISILWIDFGNILKGLILLVVAYIIFQLLFALCHWLMRTLQKIKLTAVANLSDKIYFFIVWAIIMAVCVVYAIIKYPAGIEWDAGRQIAQYIGIEPMTAHWPPFSSALMGIPVVITYNITGDLSLSVFVEVLLQSLVCTCVFAYAITFIKQLKISPIFSILALAIVCIVPIFPGFMTAVVKDTYYSTMLVWFLTLLAQLLFFDKKNYVLIGISALLVTLLRNNGVYVILICLIALLIAKTVQKKDKKILGIILGAVCVLWLLYSNVLLKALNIPKGSIAEALSIPFQQTARFYRDFPEDVAPEEHEIINNVIDAENLAELYDPVLSDAVKSTYKGDNSKLGEYFGVWLKQFFKHPLLYIESTLENSYGFWGPIITTEDDELNKFGLYRDDHLFVCTGRGYIEFKNPEALDKLTAWALKWENHLLLAPFCNFGLQIWLMLYMFINTLVKKYSKQLLIVIPLMISWLICIASPTWWNNGFRYALPIIFFNPVLTAINWKNETLSFLG